MSTQTPGHEKSLLEKIQALLEDTKIKMKRREIKTGDIRFFDSCFMAYVLRVYGEDHSITKDLYRKLDNYDIDIGKRLLLAENYLDGLNQIGNQVFVDNMNPVVFIGHGSSYIWRELKDFLEERLGLGWEEFNRESAAGKSISDRIFEMLNSVCFAFIVLSVDDQKNGKQNIAHEIGLFQGKLGFNRAIVLVEKGYGVFDNITNIVQIYFQRGSISSSFEEVRKVLEREKMIK